MKNPNGYGSVFKLSGNRRRPWTARVTVGWTDEGKQIYEYLGYFESRPDAMVALAEYNKDPYDVNARKLTFEEVYKYLMKDLFPDGANTDAEKSREKGYKMAFNHSEVLHEKTFINLRKAHLQEVIDNCPRGQSTKLKINTLFNQMYRVAMENDWVEKDYSKFVRVPRVIKETSRTPFTLEEIDLLWKNLNKYDFLDTVLIMIYTGLRPGELVTIENENIFIDKRYMIGGLKTEAGQNRIIPIHKKIKPLIEKRISNKKYLILNKRGGKMSYNTYLSDRWNPLMDQLKLKHKPHDCRHTFATLMDNAGANKLSIKKIMGHDIPDVTDGVYTHKSIDELIKAVDLLD